MLDARDHRYQVITPIVHELYSISMPNITHPEAYIYIPNK